MSDKKTKSVSGNAFDMGLLLRVLGYVKPYRSMFVFTSFTVVFAALLAPLRPFLIQFTLDETIIIPKPSLLKTMILVIVAILILEGIIQFLQTYLANWLGQSVIRDLRVDVYRKINQLQIESILIELQSARL